MSARELMEVAKARERQTTSPSAAFDSPLGEVRRENWSFARITMKYAWPRLRAEVS